MLGVARRLRPAGAGEGRKFYRPLACRTRRSLQRPVPSSPPIASTSGRSAIPSIPTGPQAPADDPDAMNAVEDGRVVRKCCRVAAW